MVEEGQLVSKAFRILGVWRTFHVFYMSPGELPRCPGCEPLLLRGVDENVRADLPTGNHDFTLVTLTFIFQRSV